MMKLKRRAFLAGMSAVVVMPAHTLLAADFKEADSLKQKSQSGALPPLKDRLPESPLVIKPVESVGRYGGD